MPVHKHKHIVKALVLLIGENVFVCHAQESQQMDMCP